MPTSNEIENIDFINSQESSPPKADQILNEEDLISHFISLACTHLFSSLDSHFKKKFFFWLFWVFVFIAAWAFSSYGEQRLL